MVSLLSQYGPSRLCKNLILGWSIWVNLIFRILTCKWLEYKDKFNICIAFHWIQGFTNAMLYQILDYIPWNYQSNLCSNIYYIQTLKTWSNSYCNRKKYMFTLLISSYHSGHWNLTKCHCEAVGLHKFYHHSDILLLVLFHIE